MTRIYLDWNAYSRIKQSNVSPYPELRNILLNKNKYLFPFSTAHILDIYESYLKVGWINIQGHIESLSISENLFIQKPFGEEIGFYIKTPKDAIKNHIKENNSEERFGELENNPDLNEVDYFPETTKFLIEEDERLKQMSMITSSFENIIHSLLSNKTKEFYQKSMNINKGKLLNKNTDPSAYLDENASSMGFETLKDFNENVLSQVNKNPDFLDEITSLFVALDMSGYKEDTNSIKSTITDSMHCAFASSCDIFIVDDKNTYFKSIETYKQKSIYTKVFRPADYVKYWNTNNLSFSNGSELINYIFNYPKNNDVSTNTELNNEFVYLLKDYILDFFNVIVINSYNEKEVKLYRYFGNNNLQLLPQEKDDILEKITSLFGNPVLINDSWNEDGILYSAWLFNELELLKLCVNEQQIMLTFTKCEKLKATGNSR